MNETDNVRPMFAEEDGSILGYMCMIDWECEIGMASGGNTVFPSIEDLKERHPCWKGCGIAEVRVTFSKTIVPTADNDGIDEDIPREFPT